MTGKNTRFIFVTGSVFLPRERHLHRLPGPAPRRARIQVSAVKMDPYINIDPGTMSPFQHGEVYVTEDAETDPDLTL